MQQIRTKFLALYTYIRKSLKNPLSFLEGMQVTVFFDRENKEKKVELGKNMLVRDLLAKMNVNPVTVIVSRGDTIIIEDEKLKENDKIKLFSVISGG